MTYFLDIKVYSPSGKTIFSDTKSFPVLIGRDADNDVVLPADNSLISREHAILEIKNATLVLTDRSSNGTFFQRKKIGQGKTVSLKPKDHFYIDEYKVTVSLKKRSHQSESDLRVRLVDENGSEKERFLLENSILMVAKVDGEVLISVNPSDAKNAKRPSQAYAEISDDNGELSINIFNDVSDFEILINNHKVRGSSRSLQIMDVIKINSFRFEIVPKITPVLRCSNSECGLLNHYNPNANCNWCGTKLAEGTTILV